MFTAIVLVCASNMKTPDNCYVYTNEILFETHKICEKNIVESVSAGVFNYYDEMTREKHLVKDYFCVNWKAERT